MTAKQARGRREGTNDVETMLTVQEHRDRGLGNAPVVHKGISISAA